MLWIKELVDSIRGVKMVFAVDADLSYVRNVEYMMDVNVSNLTGVAKKAFHKFV